MLRKVEMLQNQDACFVHVVLKLPYEGVETNVCGKTLMTPELVKEGKPGITKTVESKNIVT
jgi:hypothetical protein